MILSIRVSTVAACLLGISVGTYIGAMGAVYVADKWPQNEYFEPRAAFPAPNPLRFGRVASGESVLCDKDNRAWSLASYDSNEYGYPECGWVSKSWILLKSLGHMINKNMSMKMVLACQLRTRSSNKDAFKSYRSTSEIILILPPYSYGILMLMVFFEKPIN